ncbi:MAG TPA: 5-formyltetrahydrofolate cyclo-ligase [Nannocystaceae bacterium]|nr:5-formyltetrahydrofolate cyclo-ligase [Nannocystaceae bacterium]
MDVASEKRRLRVRLRGTRAAIASDRIASMSSALARHVQSSPAWTGAAAIAGFVGVKGEPDTRELLAAALAGGKALWLPRVLGPSEIGFARVQALAELVPGGFGLLEPPLDARFLALAEIPLDVVLVPGLAFTSAGVRLGFGRGYYDRAFTAGTPAATPVRIGVCFAEFLDIAELPSEPHDVAMHFVATDAGLIRCTPQERAR